MKYFSLMAGIMLVPALSSAQVVINEISYDDSSANDDYEFVELYNAGATAVNIGDWKVQGEDDNIAPIVTIPAGTMIGANDYYVIGRSAVPNIDQTQTVFWEQGPDSIALRNSANILIDSVFYERQASQAALLTLGEGGGIWGNNQPVTQQGFNDPNAVGAHTYYGTLTLGRYVDGLDTNNNDNDFGLAVATPGAANNSKGSVNLAAPFTANFDGAENTYSTDLVGNWFSFQTQNPTVADTLATPWGALNPTAIPASPQGGNVGILWDASGGGDMGIVNLQAPVANVRVECYVYLTAAPLTNQNAGDAEQWTFPVVRGKADGVYNFETANGDNGIRWKYRRNPSGATLTLEDYRANTPVVIGTPVTITPGTNDGWQRLYLSVSGPSVQGAVGGTLGSGIGSGTVVTGVTTHLQAGGIGYGYRENTAYTSGVPDIVGFPLRPITIDALTITEIAANVDGWQLY